MRAARAPVGCAGARPGGVPARDRSTDQGALARPRHPRHDDKDAQRDVEVDVPEVVSVRPPDRQHPECGPRRVLELRPVVKVLAGDGAADPQLLDGALEADGAARRTRARSARAFSKMSRKKPGRSGLRTRPASSTNTGWHSPNPARANSSAPKWRSSSSAANWRRPTMCRQSRRPILDAAPLRGSTTPPSSFPVRQLAQSVAQRTETPRIRASLPLLAPL